MADSTPLDDMLSNLILQFSELARDDGASVHKKIRLLIQGVHGLALVVNDTRVRLRNAEHALPIERWAECASCRLMWVSFVNHDRCPKCNLPITSPIQEVR